MHPQRIDLDAAAGALFGSLRRAERLLVEACATGDIAKVGLQRPGQADSGVSVRASFLAWLLRAAAPMNWRRVQLLGAYIEGRVDLGGAVLPGSLWFYRCHFDSVVLLDGARVAGSVTFAGCHLHSLLAEGCVIDDDLALNAGSTIDAELRLRRARIGGALDCSRLDLRGRAGRAGGTDSTRTRRALLADALRVGGDVRLGEHFQALGEVRFVAAQVGGDFHASGQFTGNLVAGGGRGVALALERIELAGSLRLDQDFGAAGQVGLRRARIGGDLDASGAAFDLLGDAAWGEGAALVLDRARIEGDLVLRELRTPLIGASFVDARVGALVDDLGTWGGRLVLDGFTYGRLGEGAPLDTRFRLDWLERQEPAHLQAQFKVQPWRRLIRVLRRMGHGHHAGSIAVRREHRLAQAGWIGAWAPRGLRWLPRAGHGVLGLLAGYGYRPGRVLGWLAAVWLACAGLYWATAAQGGAAADLLSPGAALGALAHSLDRLLPLVDLSPAEAWAAGPRWVEAVRWLGRIEAGFGWLALGLLLASVAGWTDRDRRG